MTSGVKVADEVKHLFDEMKVKKKDADESQHPRFALFVIQDGVIIVERAIREHQLSDVDDCFRYFKDLLPDKKCLYGLYDCHYENEESPNKEEMVFFMWTPDSAPIKDKMHYASSKDCLKKAFSGVKYVKEINDPAEYDLCYFADLFGKNTVKIEGKCVKSSQKKVN